MIRSRIRWEGNNAFQAVPELQLVSFDYLARGIMATNGSAAANDTAAVHAGASLPFGAAARTTGAAFDKFWLGTDAGRGKPHPYNGDQLSLSSFLGCFQGTT